MVRTFLKVYMELGSYFLFLQEQIKDIIISVRGHARQLARTSFAAAAQVRHIFYAGLLADCVGFF
jgi:hypothetical protein